MARLESEGRLFGAGLLKEDKENETTSDPDYGMFILRADSRAEVEVIVFEEPNTKAGLRTMKACRGSVGMRHQHLDQLYPMAL